MELTSVVYHAVCLVYSREVDVEVNQLLMSYSDDVALLYLICSLMSVVCCYSISTILHLLSSLDCTCKGRVHKVTLLLPSLKPNPIANTAAPK